MRAERIAAVALLVVALAASGASAADAAPSRKKAIWGPVERGGVSQFPVYRDLGAAPLKVLVVVGARPNFVKVAPVVHALAALGVDTPVVNTGQHYDRALVGVFLHDEPPDVRRRPRHGIVA
jgi:hypothetical protein